MIEGLAMFFLVRREVSAERRLNMYNIRRQSFDVFNCLDLSRVTYCLNNVDPLISIDEQWYQMLFFSFSLSLSPPFRCYRLFAHHSFSVCLTEQSFSLSRARSFARAFIVISLIRRNEKTLIYCVLHRPEIVHSTIVIPKSKSNSKP